MPDKKPLKDFLISKQSEKVESKKPLTEFIKEKTDEYTNTNKALFLANSGIYDPSAAGGTAKYDTLGELDKNLVLGEDQNELRANNQSNWDKLGNALIRTGSELTLGTLKSITDIPDNIRAIFDQTGIVEKDFTNDLSNWLGSLKQDIEEANPIYTPQSAEGFSPTSMSWWANNMPSIASAATFIVPTLLAAKVAGMATKATGLIKMLGAKGDYVTRGLAGTIYSNLAESMQDAIPLAQQKYQEALEAGFSEGEAREIGSKAGWNVYTGNLTNIALDLPSTFTLLKGFKSSRNLLKKNNITKALGMEVLPEAAQEATNFISKAEAERGADIEIGKIEDDESSFTSRVMDKYLQDPDLWTASFFGAIGGGVFQGVSHIKDRITGEYKAQAEIRNNQEQQLAKLAGQRATELGIQTNNEQLFNEGQDQILFENAYENAKLGTSEAFIDKLKEVQSYSEEELANLGLERDKLQEKIAKAKQIEDLYNDTIVKYGESKGSIDFNKKIVQSLYDKKVYLDNLTKVNAEINAKKADLVKTANELEEETILMEAVTIPFINEGIRQLAAQKGRNTNSLKNILKTKTIKGDKTRKRRYEARKPIVDRLNAKLDKKIQSLQQEVKLAKEKIKSLDQVDEVLAEINLDKYPQFEEYKNLIQKRTDLEQGLEIADEMYQMATTPEGRAFLTLQEEGKKEAKTSDDEVSAQETRDFEYRKKELLEKADSGFLEDSKGIRFNRDEINITPENINEYKAISEQQLAMEAERLAANDNINNENGLKNKVEKTVNKKDTTEQVDEIIPYNITDLNEIESKITDIPTPFKTASIDKRNEGAATTEKQKALNHYHSFTESLTLDDIKDGKLKFKAVNKPEKTPLYNSEYPDAIILQVVDKKGKGVSFEGSPVYTYLPLADSLEKQWTNYFKNNPAKLKVFTDKLSRFKELKEEIEKALANDEDIFFNIVNFNSGQLVYKLESSPLAFINPELASTTNVAKAYRGINLALSTENQKITDNTGSEVSLRRGTLWTTLKGKALILNNRKLTENEIDTAFVLLKEFKAGNEYLSIDGKKIDVRKALQNIIFFGANTSKPSEHMIYIDNKKDLWYGKRKLVTNEDVKVALADKYINVSNATLKSQKEQYTEIYTTGDLLATRVWNSYNEYLLSDKLPNGTTRDKTTIPFTSNVQTYGKPQVIGRYLVYEDKTYTRTADSSPIQDETQNSTDITINDLRDIKEGDSIVLENANATFTFNSKGEFVSRIDKKDPSKNIVGEEEYKSKANDGLKTLAKGVKDGVANPKLLLDLSKTITIYLKRKTDKAPDNFTIAREVKPVETVQSKKTVAELQAELRKKRQDVNKPSFERSSTLTLKGYKVENIEKAREWYKSVFGSDEDFDVVEGLIRTRAFGEFNEVGRILLSDIAEEGTIYHEAYHKAHNLYFTDYERRSLIEEAMKDSEAMKAMAKAYPELDQIGVAEEVLAEKFREYVLIGNTEISLFKRLYNFIKKIILGKVSSDEMFQRIATGYYRNAPKYDYNTNAKLFRVITINGQKMSEVFTKDVMDSITYFMFNNLFEGNLTYANLFNKKNTVKIAYERTLEDFKAELNNLTDLGQTEGITVEELEEITSKANALESIIQNWSAILPNHYDYFKQLGITLKADKSENTSKEDNDDYDNKIEDTSEEERLKDTVFDKAAYEFSSIDSLPKNIKLLITTLTDGGVNSLGIPKLVDFHKTYAYLANQLSELTFDEMVDKLASLDGVNKPYVAELLDRLKAGRKDLTEDDLKLQIQFANEMSKTKLKFYLGYISEDGRINFGDANQNKAENKVAEKWKSLIKDSKYVKNVNGKLVIKDIPTAKNVYDWLEELGIKVTFKNKLSDEDIPKFNTSITYIKKALEEQVNKEDVEDIFQLKDIGRRLNDLVALEVKYSDEYTENQHINAEGKSVYDITLPSALTKTVAKIKQGKWNEIEYIDTVYNKRSIWIDRIKKGFTDVEIALLDGMANTVDSEGTHTSKLSTADKTSQELNSLLGGQSMTSMLRMADKKSEYAIKGFGLAISIEKFKTRPISEIEEVKDIFYGYFLDELERIQDWNYNKGYKNIETYNSNGGKWTIFDGILYQETKDKLKFIQENYKQEVPKDIENRVKSEITEFLTAESEREFASMGREGLFKMNKKYYIGIDKDLQDRYAPNRSEKEVKDLVSAYTVNRIINHIEQIKLFYGDLAFFKYAKGDFFKRTPYISAAKKQAVNDSTFNQEFLSRTTDFGIGDRQDKKHQEKPDLIGKVQTITFDDIVFESPYFNEYLDEIKKYLKSKGIPKSKLDEEARKLLDPYTKVNEADAQGYITLDEYREFLNRTGDWTSKHETLYRKYRTGESIKAEDMYYFMPLKAQYSAIHKDGELAKPVFHKYSLMPLIPSLVKGTNLEKLSKYMTDNKIGYSLYKSGSKIAPKLKANGTYNHIYKNGEFLGESDFVVEEVSYDNLGIQVEIAPKLKNKLIDGTQQRKLKWSDIFEEGKAVDVKLKHLYEKYCDTYDKIFEIEKNSLIEELGLKEVKEDGEIKYEQVDLTKLVETLREEGISRNSPDNLIDGLEVAKKGDKIVLKYPFDALPNRNKIESIIMSIAMNRVVKFKQNGEGYIQGSIAGFESIGKRDFGVSSRLKFYRKEKGKTLPAQLAIPLPEELLTLLDKYDSKLSEEEKIELLNNDIKEGSIDKSLLTLIGYRIPTQGLNSIESFEVGFFLPRTVGSLCLVPSEMTAKAGSDFDIDKLNVFRLNVKPGTTELATEGKEGLQNELINITKEIIEHPRNFIKLITPNNTNTLLDTVEELRKITPKSDKTATDTIIPRKVVNIAKQFLDGKDGVGIAAVHNTHHVLSQIADLNIDADIALENNGTLAKLTDVEGNNISDVLSEIINAFVDVAKDPFIRDLNLNTRTANIYLTLIRFGVPFKKIAYFMNQPIIREYISAKEFNNSIIVQKTGFHHRRFNPTGLKLSNEKLKNAIKKNYPTTGNLSKGHYTTMVNDEDILKNAIKKQGLEINDLNLLQKAVLDDFLYYESIASKLSEVMSVSNQDTKTPNNIVTLNDNLIKFNKVSEYKDVKNFANIFKKENKENLLGVFKKAHDVTKQVTSPLFITQNPKINSIIVDIVTKLNIGNAEERSKMLKTVENDFLHFIIQNRAEFEGKKFKDWADTLFKGEKSLAKRLLIIKEGRSKRYTPELQDKLNANLFIKELYPIINAEVNGSDIVKLFNKRMTTYDSNILTNSFMELYEIAPTLADAIAVTGIMQSGIANSAISFTDKIPFEVYGKFLRPVIEELQLNDGQAKDLDYNYFEYLFYANNMKNKNVKTRVSEVNKALAEQGVDHKIKALGDWRYKNYNTENSIDLSNIDIQSEPEEEITDEDMLQIESTSEQESITDLNNKMLAFFNEIGVDYKVVDEIKDRAGNPMNIVAKADLLNRVLSVVEGKSKVDTLPEEAAHFFVDLLPENHPLLKSMLSEIHKYPETAEVFSQYNDIYGGNYDKLAKEAIGKVIAKEIVNQYLSPEASKAQQVKSWWNSLWNYFKSLFKKSPQRDAFKEAALKILNKEVAYDKSYKIKEGIDLVFNENRELSTIGTKEEYSKYLDSIFVDSSVKDILYHGSSSKIDKFKKSLDETGNFYTGIYFTDNITYLKELGKTGKNTSKITPVIINSIDNFRVKEPIGYGTGQYWYFEQYDSITGRDAGQTVDGNVFAVRKPSQIHILGSKEDIQGFKNWKNSSDNSYFQLSEVPTEKAEHAALFNKIKEVLHRQIKIYEKRVESESEVKALDSLRELEETLDKVNILEGIELFSDKATKLVKGLQKRIIEIKSYTDKRDFKDKYKRDSVIRDLNEINEFNESLRVVEEINKLLALEGKQLFAEAETGHKFIANLYNDLAIPLMADYLFDFYNKGINQQLIKSGNKDKVLTRELLEEELRQSKKDISKLESWLVATSNLDDAILGLFAKSVKKQLYEANRLDIINQEEIEDKFNKWIKTQSSRDNNKKLFGKFITKVDDFGKDRLKFIEVDSDSYKALSKEDREFYDELIKLHLNSQKGIPEANRLGYFLPALSKTSKEYLVEEGKVKIVDKAKEQEIRNSLQTLEGKNLKRVPIYYTHYIDPSEQSYNIVEAVLSYTSEINKYKAYNEIQAHVNTIQNLVNKNQPLSVDDKGDNITDSLSKAIGNNNFLKSETNNRAEKLNTFIDMIFYGIDRKTEKTTIFGKEINYGKWGDRLTGFTAINALAGDALQAFNNVTIGNLTSFAEGLGGRNYSTKDWWSANTEYFANSAELLGEVGSGKRSFISKLAREYDAIQGQFKDNKGTNITSSRFYNLMETDSIFFLQNGTEHQIQITTFIAFLKGKKVKDKSGKEISLYDAYKENYKENKTIGLPKEYEFTKQDKEDLRDRIHSANKKNNGVYNKFDSLPMQQYTLGRMALMFRKFIAPTVRARFGGLSIDYESGLVNQGYYKSFAKKLIQAYNERSIAVMFKWKDMSEYEREGVKRSMVDLITLTTTFVLVLALTKGEDDEEPTAVDNFLLYQAMRLHGDISFYMPGIGFNDQFRVLRTPTAVAGTVDKGVKLLSQIFSVEFETGELGLLETYKRDSGLNKEGDYKVISRAEKLIPVYNNIVESSNPEYAISVLNKIKN